MCDCGYTLHYKMISLILTSLEIFSTYLGCLCKQANGSHFSKLPKRGWNAKLYPTFMLICLWAPVQLLQVHPQFWVELESEGSLVAFSEIGYHHFTSSPSGLKMTTSTKRHFNAYKSCPLRKKKKWWKLGVLILKKWKVHTNTAKSKGLGFLSKAKKKP